MDATDGEGQEHGGRRDEGAKSDGHGVPANGRRRTGSDEASATGTGRTVVLGFDALDFRYLDAFADDLPNFGALRDRGVEAPLRSTIPPWTGSAWPSMYTGRDPSHHGVYDFFVYDGHPDTATVATRNDVDAPAIWNYLTAAGRRSIVVNVPVTHPAEPVDGVLLPGYLAPEDAPGHPERIREDVTAAIGEPYRIYSRAELAADGDEKLAGYLDLIDLRRRTAEHLLAGDDWEFAFVQVQKTDAVFHNFTDETAFRSVYQAADAFLGGVLDVIDETDDVIVCSDHGIGPKDGYTVYLNEILRDHGFVETSGGEGGAGASLDDVKPGLTGEAVPDTEGDEGALVRIAGGASRVLGAVGIDPGDVFTAAERVGLDGLLLRMTPESVRAGASRAVNWRRSTAYCRSNAEPGVRINLAGRDTGGVVPAEDYEAVRAELIELLEGLETPDGRHAFEAVLPAEAVYDGPYVGDACDVVVVPRDMANTVDTKLYGRRFVRAKPYDHERDGVFLGAGPGFDPEGDLDSLSLIDVAPIAMALLGHPVPTDMTGAVPSGLLRVPVERESYGSVPFGTGIDRETEDDEVTSRLEDLGYL